MNKLKHIGISTKRWRMRLSSEKDSWLYAPTGHPRLEAFLGDRSESRAKPVVKLIYLDKAIYGVSGL